ncbi:MAG: hypothetical protein OXI83_05405 [Gemmatimonadota bacterium]|nr:hypothetical protein [Gemmatimonadota bacterium]
MTIPRAVGLTSGRFLSTILLLPLLHACAPSDASPPASTQRDSAGIAIVESVRAAWGDSAHWWLDSEPLLDLATAGTSDPHDFYAVRGMKRLSDGSLVVLNAGSDEVRQFSADGRFVGSFGGTGEGPGEFTNARQLELAGDTILVLDWDSMLSVFGPGPELIRDVRLRPSTRAVHFIGDGHLVARVVASLPGTGALVRIPEALFTHRLDGSDGDSIGWIAGFEDYTLGDMGQVPFFQKEAVVDSRGERIFTGSSDLMQVEEMAANGDTVRILRIAGYPLGLTPAQAEAERDHRLDIPLLQQTPMPPRVQRLREFIENMPLPTTRPAYDDLIVDPSGAVWLRPFRGASEQDGPEFWLVLDPAGRWLGSVEVPEDFRVRDIGMDEVLGVWHDEMDVQHPQVLRLRREGE